jgi:hypothetical protein
MMEASLSHYTILVGKAQRKTQLRRSRCTEDDIKMDLTGTESEDVDWVHLSQDSG